MINIFDLCGIPAFLEPWITRFYTPAEMELLQTLNGQAMTAVEVSQHMSPQCTDSFLDR